MVLPKKIAFIDLETTGGSAANDRIIEVGVVRVEDNRVVETFSSLVDPQTSIGVNIERITGINNEMVRCAPTFYAIADRVVELLDDCIFVAHNVRFDYSFLKSEFKRVNVDYSAKHFCTVKLSRYLYPELARHNLDAIIERFGFTIQNRHRALGDATMLWQFYQEVIKLFGKEHVAKAVNILMKKPFLPINLDKKEIDLLPHSAGVYIFYGKEGVPLYVGKSVNLKDRILSHFAADLTSNKEMQISQQIVSIETIKTAGEFGALVKESTLVKQLKPIYNRKLRQCKRFICALRSDVTQQYGLVNLATIEAFTPAILTKAVGIFKSIRQAKTFLEIKAKEYHLCKKLLGLEYLKGPCFGYRLGLCKGACAQRESINDYNARYNEAFGLVPVLPWPYPSPVAVFERCEDQLGGDIFIIDNWCLLANKSYADENEAQQIVYEYAADALFEGQDVDERVIPFDYDTYKILFSYLLNTKNRRNIRVICDQPAIKQSKVALPTEIVFSEPLFS